MRLVDRGARCARPFGAGRSGGRPRMQHGARAQAAATEKLKPDWAGAAGKFAAQLVWGTFPPRPRTWSRSACAPGAGDDPLSRLVNAAIGFKPLYALMKVGAKQVLQSTAERNGVPWRATARQLQNTPEVRPGARPRLGVCMQTGPPAQRRRAHGGAGTGHTGVGRADPGDTRGAGGPGRALPGLLRAAVPRVSGGQPVLAGRV